MNVGNESQPRVMETPYLRAYLHPSLEEDLSSICPVERERARSIRRRKRVRWTVEDGGFREPQG